MLCRLGLHSVGSGVSMRYLKFIDFFSLHLNLCFVQGNCWWVSYLGFYFYEQTLWPRQQDLKNVASGNCVFANTQTEMSTTSLSLELLWGHHPGYIPSKFMRHVTDLH